MQNNLVFLCGPHGSGKTTLGDEIANQNSRIVIPELFSRNLKFHTTPIYRQALKTGTRASENFEYLQLAKQNPGRIILGNRCVYDVLAYNQVYLKKKWISQEEYQKLNSLIPFMFQEENQEPYAIVLNPGFDVCRTHLQKRWEKKAKKWNEEDEDYLRTACSSYEQFQDNQNILCINHEVNLDSQREIAEAEDWITSLSHEPVAV